MMSIKKWLHKQRELNSGPIDVPYTYVYNIGPLPLEQPWRKTNPDAILVPTNFILGAIDIGRVSLIRNRDREMIAELEQDMLKNGIKTPLELWIDSTGHLRLQEGYHRMVVAEGNPLRFPRVPVILKVSDGKIKSYGISIVDHFPFILQQLGKPLYEA